MSLPAIRLALGLGHTRQMTCSFSFETSDGSSRYLAGVQVEVIAMKTRSPFSQPENRALGLVSVLGLGLHGKGPSQPV